MFDLLKTELSPDCHIDKNSVHQNGIGVSFKPLASERARFFDSDCPSAKKCFAMDKEGIKCCDYLFIYARDEDSGKHEILCFLELKGGDVKQSVKQIKDTHTHFTIFSEDHLDRKQRPNIAEGAAIYIRTSSPMDVSRKAHRDLAKTFKPKHIDIKHCSRNFDHFIRKIYDEN